MSVTAAHHRELKERGFTILENIIPRDLLQGLQHRVHEIFAEEGDQAGSEFKQETGSRRLANLVNKGAIFQQVVNFPPVLELTETVLGSAFKLSSMNVRSVDPHWNHPQPLHADMGAIPDERGFWVCNSVWMLDEFTLENGPIRVIPGTHHSGKLPQEELADPTAPHPDELALTGSAGTIVVMNAHLWHGGMPNHTSKPRTALHGFYARYDKPQQQHQKALLSDAVQDSLSPQLRKLLALDDRLNDEISAAPATRSGFLK